MLQDNFYFIATDLKDMITVLLSAKNVLHFFYVVQIEIVLNRIIFLKSETDRTSTTIQLRREQY